MGGKSNDIKCLQYKAREVIQLNVLSICAFFPKHIKYVSQNISHAGSPCAVNVCPVATQFNTNKSAPNCHLLAPQQLTYCDRMQQQACFIISTCSTDSFRSQQLLTWSKNYPHFIKPKVYFRLHKNHPLPPFWAKYTHSAPHPSISIKPTLPHPPAHAYKLSSIKPLFFGFLYKNFVFISFTCHVYCMPTYFTNVYGNSLVLSAFC